MVEITETEAGLVAMLIEREYQRFGERAKMSSLDKLLEKTKQHKLGLLLSETRLP